MSQCVPPAYHIHGWDYIHVVFDMMHPILQSVPCASNVASDLIHTYGSSSIAYFTLSKDKSYYFNMDGNCIIPYVIVHDVALGAGDPIGPPEEINSTIQQFRDSCDDNGWVPAFYEVREATLPLYLKAGFQALKIGEEALVDIQEFNTKGKAKGDLREVVNRAAREGWQFLFFDQPINDAELAAQIEAISEAWLAEKFGGEMGFTMGGTPITGSSETLVTVATDAKGKVMAFMTWAPIYGIRGWAVDFMRRAPDGPNGVIDYITVSTIERLRERGCQVLSLGLAPLANVKSENVEAHHLLENGINVIYERFNTGYHFKSLRQFKQKFGPRWENRYLVYPSVAAFPRVIYALVNAQMPNFSVHELCKLVHSQWLQQRPMHLQSPWHSESPYRNAENFHGASRSQPSASQPTPR